MNNDKTLLDVFIKQLFDYIFLLPSNSVCPKSFKINFLNLQKQMYHVQMAQTTESSESEY